MITPFEPHRFQSSVEYYRAGRPVYPAALFRRVVELTGLNGSHRVLDIGCGPGPVAIGFAYFAGDVLALDPEPLMLAAAREAAQGLVSNVTFEQASSYDLAPSMGRFQLATMGRSFHWMDRADTLARLDGILEPNGAVALLDDKHLDVPDNHWLAGCKDILKRYGGDDPVRQHIKSREYARHEAVLLDSPFSVLQRVSVIERRAVPVRSFVDRACSMSSTAPARLGERTADMRRELEELLEGVARAGQIFEVVEFSALIAFRA